MKFHTSDHLTIEWKFKFTAGSDDEFKCEIILIFLDPSVYEVSL